MAGRAPRPSAVGPSSLGADDRILIIEGRYYETIANELLGGALAELAALGVGHDVITVPGALEIPQVLAQAAEADLISPVKRAKYCGVVVLGCVIRGETSHYDIVCNNANHWLMEIAIDEGIPVGNAILTVDTEAQAMARAEGGRDGKGGDAVRACARVIEIARGFRSQSE